MEEKSNDTLSHGVFLLFCFFLNVLFNFLSWIALANQKLFKSFGVSTILVSSQNYFAFSLNLIRNFINLHLQHQRSSRIPFGDSICRNNISCDRLSNVKACVWKTSLWILSFKFYFSTNEVLMQFVSLLVCLVPKQKSSCHVSLSVFVFQLQRWWIAATFRNKLLRLRVSFAQRPGQILHLPLIITLDTLW